MRRAIAGILIICWSAGARAEYPDMMGTWAGEVRIVNSGDQVLGEVAKGGAVIANVNLRLEITYQDGEVFVGESMTDAPRAQPTPIWGAIRSTGKQAIFVTSGGGRGNVWFNTPTQFEYCFTNQTQALMAAHCAVLKKVSEG